jgi:DNA-binding NarL/FixJ family response regulator
MLMKDQWLERHESGKLRYESIGWDEVQVRIYGDAAVVLTEREVLAISANGATIEDIAAKLYLSEGTVRNYLSTAIKKLGTRNRVEAARLAERKGWL